jgi:hypothetical protein
LIDGAGNAPRGHDGRVHRQLWHVVDVYANPVDLDLCAPRAVSADGSELLLVTREIVGPEAARANVAVMTQAATNQLELWHDCDNYEGC